MEQPPLPDEAPPLPDEEPPLPDEEPPLPDEEPPLPDEEPPLPDEEPPLPDEEPPLPDEEPPLPNEELPANEGQSPQHYLSHPPNQQLHPIENDEQAERPATTQEVDDGWQAILDPSSKQYYFYNSVTQETTWDNPRKCPSQTIPDDYTKHFAEAPRAADFAFQARFDRRTGRFVSDPNRDTENYTPEARAARQMSQFFDTSKMEDTGESAKAERRALKHSKQELQFFKQKQKEKREHKRRAWLTAD